MKRFTKMTKARFNTVDHIHMSERTSIFDPSLHVYLGHGPWSRCEPSVNVHPFIRSWEYVKQLALSMDIFKLNYQFQSDFHNFLNVISISNWCCDAKTNNGPYSMSAESVECYNIWGWGDRGGRCVISAVIHWEGLSTITSVTWSPTLHPNQQIFGC